MSNDFIGSGGYGKSSEAHVYRKSSTFAREWYAVSESACRSTGSYFSALGWDVDYEPGLPWVGRARITTTALDGDTPVTGSENSGSVVSGSTVRWSYGYTSVQKDFLESHDVIPWLRQIPSDAMSELKKSLNDGTQPAFNFGEMSDLQISSSVVASLMIQRGYRTVPVSIPVIRRQMAISETQDQTWFHSYVDRVWSKASLVNSEYVPSRYANQMPQDSDPNPTTTDGITYIYGWLKMDPNIEDGNPGECNVSQEWHYGLWPQNVKGPKL